MKIVILGFGQQGQAALEYWQSDENEITICDANPKLKVPQGVKKQLGLNYLENLDGFDLLVRSPSVHPRDIIVANPNHVQLVQNITTVTNEFFRVCPSKNIIGVTGTKGKGTTSTLIAKMLTSAGKKVHLGGNIGIAPLDMLKEGIQPEDWVVLELANFQLIDIEHSPYIGVCLMVVPEHLDWHSSTEEYITAKQQLFVNQGPGDFAVFYPKSEASTRITSVSHGQKIPYFKKPGALIEKSAVMIEGHKVCDVSEIKLLGQHNLQNVCAAVTVVWQVSQNLEAMRSVLTTFSGLPYRLEFMREVDGVKYYNDSFGTTPETAIVAIEAFKEPKVVILGGSDKGAPYEELSKAVKNGNVRAVVTIGVTATLIEKALRAKGFDKIVKGGETMGQIVKAAKAQSKAGDTVLLSTGCASFGLFKNYKDRGEKFTKAVKAL